MRCKKDFCYIDKGKSKTLVLLPGWATDCRIFAGFNPDYDYLLPVDFSPYTFERSFLRLRENSGKQKFSLFGWSMGGFTAADFAGKYPELVDELILVGIRRKYIKEQLDEIRNYIKSNRKGYLYKFYTQCFFTKEEILWFKRNLLNDYCERWQEKYLLETLDYLEKSTIEPSFLEKVRNIRILHGEFDKISPIQESRAVKNELGEKAVFVCIKNTGHAPFLNKNLSKYL